MCLKMSLRQNNEGPFTKDIGAEVGRVVAEIWINLTIRRGLLFSNAGASCS